MSHTHTMSFFPISALVSLFFSLGERKGEIQRQEKRRFLDCCFFLLFSLSDSFCSFGTQSGISSVESRLAGGGAATPGAAAAAGAGAAAPPEEAPPP